MLEKGYKQVDLSEIEQQIRAIIIVYYGRNNVTMPNQQHDIQQVKAKLRNKSELKIESLGHLFWAIYPEHGPPPIL